MFNSPDPQPTAAPVARPDRARVQRMIRDVYRATYAASVKRVQGVLFATRSGDGAIAAACGLNWGEAGFFSQCYMDEPIDAEITSAAGVRVERTRLVEIGSLAAFRPGSAPALFHGIIGYSRSRGIQAAVFTATLPVRRKIAHAGLRVIEIRRAARDRVADPEAWGTYYDHDPMVCAILAETAKVRTPVPLSLGIRTSEAGIARYA